MLKLWILNKDDFIWSPTSIMDATFILKLLEVFFHLFAYFFPEQAQVKDCATYDIIIVGGGSAGCVLAGRLSENANLSVLLIEAGDNPTLEVMFPGLATYNAMSRFDWNYTSVNNSNSYQCYKGDVFQTTRGHGLGGSSSVNYMMYVRGNRNDYQQWAKTANSSAWNYDHVLPYFKKSERMENPSILHSKYKSFHGTDGPMGINIYPDLEKLKYLEALNDVGYKTVLDTNDKDSLGFNFPMYNVAEGLRQSSCFCFVSPVKCRKNLNVLRNTKVTKILIERSVATGVQLLTESNEMLTLKANLEVILSAGAFNTPQLLMLSGVGPREHLQSLNIPVLKDLPVGYNLQDHTGVIILHQTDTYTVPADESSSPLEPQYNFINGFFALNKSQRYPDAQLLLLSTRKAPQAVLQIIAGYDSDIYERAIAASTGRELSMSVIFNLRPVSRGRVMLNSADPNDPPKIDLGAFTNQTDVDNMVLYIKDYLRIENSTYFKNVSALRVDLPGDRCSSFTMGSDDYWECYTRCSMSSIYHYCGTCPMGTVVDSRLRVLGIRKLRVVDASVFPTIPSGNTNAPTIMTAEVAADMIKTDHKMNLRPHKSSGSKHNF